MRLAALLALVAVFSYAQAPTPQYEVFGKVTEPSIGPLPGVILNASDREAGIVTTDTKGEFRIRVNKPGPFGLLPRKEGYSSGNTMPFVVLDAAHPTAELNIEMQRLGRIGGRVIDDVSRSTLAGFDVYLVSTDPSQSSPPRPAITDEEGRFTFTDLFPGDYVATTRAPVSERQWALEVFKPDDATLIEEGYEESFWPGGNSLDLALPVHLSSGGAAEIGTISARKTTYYRVQLHLTGACGAVAMAEVEIYRRGSKSFGHTYPFPCQTPLLLLGLDRASYLLRVHTPQSSALYPLEVSDKNLDVEIPLRPNIIIEGQWIPAKGMGAIPANLPLTTRVEVLPGVFFTGGQIEHGKENSFRLSVPPDPQVIQIRYLPGYPYASQIRYNGAPLRSGVLEINPGAAAHRLEIVLDNQPATITGEVSDGSRPIPGAIVTLAPEGYRGEYAIGMGIGKRATADAQGRFELTGLVPGDYRIFAVPSAASAAAYKPESLMSLLRDAQKLKVEPAASQAITVRITNPR